jgi:hypothetical protein
MGPLAFDQMTTGLVSLLIYTLLHSHPLHVSVTSIDINQEKSEASFSFKFYTDDFKLLFFHLYEKNIKPEMNQELTAAELELISRYLNRAFTIVSGSDTLDFEYVRKDQNEESLWLYFKGNLPGGKKDPFRLTNMLLLDLYEDQTNLVIITHGAHEEGYTFNNSMRQQEIDVHQD